MPRKGSRGQTAPDDRDDEQPIDHPERDGPLPGAIDQSLDDDEDEPRFMYGDLVEFRLDPDSSTYVVVNIPEPPAQYWEEDGESLIDKYPRGDGEDDVIIVVEEDELDEAFPDWCEREEEIPLDELDDVESNAYPSSLLVRKEDSHLRE